MTYQFITRTYRKEEIQRILQHYLNKKGWIYKRDYMAIKLALETGLRINEIVNVRLTDIDHKERLLWIRPENNKNKREEFIYLNKPLYQTLMFYWKGLSARRLSKEWYIFPSRFKRFSHITSWGLRRSFEGMRKELGIDSIRGIATNGNKLRRFNFHGLRKTFCTMLFQANPQARINEIAMASRHRDLEVLQNIYIELEQKEVQRRLIENTFIEPII